MSATVIVLRVAAEGGSLALLAEHMNDGSIRYQRALIEQAGTFLSEDQVYPEIRNVSEWVTTWSAALQLLDRYPWPNLGVTEVHRQYAAQVLAAVTERFAKEGNRRNRARLLRCREYCKSAP